MNISYIRVWCICLFISRDVLYSRHRREHEFFAINMSQAKIYRGSIEIYENTSRNTRRQAFPGSSRRWDGKDPVSPSGEGNSRSPSWKAGAPGRGVKRGARWRRATEASRDERPGGRSHLNLHYERAPDVNCARVFCVVVSTFPKCPEQRRPRDRSDLSHCARLRVRRTGGQVSVFPPTPPILRSRLTLTL